MTLVADVFRMLSPCRLSSPCHNDCYRCAWISDDFRCLRFSTGPWLEFDCWWNWSQKSPQQILVAHVSSDTYKWSEGQYHLYYLYWEYFETLHQHPWVRQSLLLNLAILNNCVKFHCWLHWANVSHAFIPQPTGTLDTHGADRASNVFLTMPIARRPYLGWKTEAKNLSKCQFLGIWEFGWLIYVEYIFEVSTPFF